ncbi:DUF418 domain-containing protein [Arthrobacter flavus]
MLGIIFVNLPFLALSNDGLSAASITSVGDGVVGFLIVALAQGKFYLLFAFLFGYSLTLILRKRTSDGMHRYRRRLVGLAVLGLLHAVFFFIGDILFSYAILGVILLWFVTRSTKTALIGAAVSYTVGLLVLVALVVISIGATTSAGGIISDPGALNRAIEGTFIDAASARLTVLPEALIFQSILNWAPALAMFLLGLAAGRAGVLAEPERYRKLWRWLLGGAVLIGLPAGAFSAWLVLFADDPTGFSRVLGVAIGFGTAPILSGGYVAVAAMTTTSRVAALTAPAGRMSLTGYLGESVILAAIFSGWGLGLFGELTLVGAAAVAFAVWLGLEIFAKVWLSYFAFGPMEWLLRCWSNAQWMPLRRADMDTKRLS